MQCKALFFILFFPTCLGAQNLVPNGSFEDYISCPDILDGMEFVEHWYKSIIYPGIDYYNNPSPDYFHVCALNPALGVPENQIGTQAAQEGLAYSGLFTYSVNYVDRREVMGIQLVSGLIPGQTYYCSMYMVRPVEWYAVGIASNNLGMKFSNQEIYSSTEEAIDGLAHLKIEEVAIDSVNWVLLYGEFVPDQSYQYLHIGNFFTDSETELDFFDGEAIWAYYFIDNVRVGTEPLLVTTDGVVHKGNQLGSYPNPFEDVLNIEVPSKVLNVSVYSVTGELLRQFGGFGSGLFRLDLGYLSSGLYMLVVYFENGEIESIRIIKN